MEIQYRLLRVHITAPYNVLMWQCAMENSCWLHFLWDPRKTYAKNIEVNLLGAHLSNLQHFNTWS